MDSTVHSYRSSRSSTSPSPSAGAAIPRYATRLQDDRSASRFGLWRSTAHSADGPTSNCGIAWTGYSSATSTCTGRLQWNHVAPVESHRHSRSTYICPATCSAIAAPKADHQRHEYPTTDYGTCKCTTTTGSISTTRAVFAVHLLPSLGTSIILKPGEEFKWQSARDAFR
jgi:hypothetical protein